MFVTLVATGRGHGEWWSRLEPVYHSVWLGNTATYAQWPPPFTVVAAPARAVSRAILSLLHFAKLERRADWSRHL
jgi:hypothetical protein